MKVLFIDTVHPCLQDELEAAGFECDIQTTLSRDEVEKIIPHYEGIVTRSKFKLDKQLLSKADKLKFIARSGSGLEAIDVEYATSKGITCFNAPEGNRDAVGEHAIAMLLTLFNKLIPADKEVRQGKWNRERHRGIELMGKTVAIIGYGNTGSAFAKKLSGFDVNVIAYDKYKEGYGNGKVKETDMKEVFNEADVLSFHVPLTEETTYYLNVNFIDKFKKDFYLINTSRGRVVNTADLVEALKSGKIAGACLDVLEYESASLENLVVAKLPAAFNYLIKSDKVVLSPHVAGWTEESYRKLSEVLAKKIKIHRLRR